ncbi:MAG: hypothetical protein QY318_00880 [Candidatus Dojkabacteria bacterium]|nr:MAG: hypothetical protein QY318_00880 [Candidatus Dojkabacteria bacterium]
MDIHLHEAIGLAFQKPEKPPAADEVHVVWDPYSTEVVSQVDPREASASVFEKYREAQQGPIYHRVSLDGTSATVYASAYPQEMPEGVVFVNNYADYREVVISEAVRRARLRDIGKEVELNVVLIELMDGYREISRAREWLLHGDISGVDVFKSICKLVSDRGSSLNALLNVVDPEYSRSNEGNEVLQLLFDVPNLIESYNLAVAVGDQTSPDLYEAVLKLTQFVTSHTSRIMESLGIPYFAVLALDGAARKDFSEIPLRDLYKQIAECKKIHQPTIEQAESLFVPIAKSIFRGGMRPLADLYVNSVLCEVKLHDLFSDRVRNYNKMNGVKEGQVVDTKFMQFEFSSDEVDLILQSSGIDLRELLDRGVFLDVSRSKRDEWERLKAELGENLAGAVKIFQERSWVMVDRMGLGIAGSGNYYRSEILIAFDNVNMSVSRLLECADENGRLTKVSYRNIELLILNLRKLRKAILM